MNRWEDGTAGIRKDVQRPGQYLNMGPLRSQERSPKAIGNVGREAKADRAGSHL